MDYLVTWELELSAPNPFEAAKQARSAQLRRGIRATVFDVHSEGYNDVVRVDLTAAADTEIIPEPKAQGVLNPRELAAVLDGLKLLRIKQLAAEGKGSGRESNYGDRPSRPYFTVGEPSVDLGMSAEEIDRLSSRIDFALA